MRRPSPRARLTAILSPEPYGGGAPVWAQASLIMTCAIIYGFQFVAFKAGFRGVGQWTMLSVRAAIAAPTILLIMRWAGVPIRVGRSNLLRVLVPATLMMCSQTLFVFGVHRLSASLTATLVSTMPIFSVVLGLLFAIDRVGLLAVVGAAAGVAGVAISTGAASGSVDGLGVALILAANLVYGLSLVALRRMALRVSSATFLAVMLAETAIVAAPLAAAAEGFSVAWSWQAVLGVLYLAFFGQTVAYLGVMTLLRFGGMFQSTLVTPLIPVWAIFFAVLLLGEPLLKREVAGAALIIGGVVLAIAPLKRRAAAARE